MKKFVVYGALTALAVSLTGCVSNTYETSVEDNSSYNSNEESSSNVALSSQNISNAFGAVVNVNSNSKVSLSSQNSNSRVSLSSQNISKAFGTIVAGKSSSNEEAKANEDIIKAYEKTIDTNFQSKVEVTPNVLGLVRPNIFESREIIRPVFTVGKKRITAVGVGETRVIAHNKAIAKFLKVANCDYIVAVSTKVTIHKESSKTYVVTISGFPVILEKITCETIDAKQADSIANRKQADELAAKNAEIQKANANLQKANADLQKANAKIKALKKSLAEANGELPNNESQNNSSPAEGAEVPSAFQILNTILHGQQ